MDKTVALVPELYQPVVDRLGLPLGASPLIEAAVARYRGHIPDSFLDFIKVSGYGIWQKGFWQFCDPEAYRGLLPLIFGKDREFQVEEMHVLGFSAFGKLVVWNETYRVVKVFISKSQIACSKYVRPKVSASHDQSLAIVVGHVDDAAYDQVDEDGKHLFKRCLRAYGQLEPGQIYAPILPPAIGGEFRLENFQKADALVSLSIMAQWDRFRLVDHGSIPQKVIREIG
jgi:hypothetical protein